MNSIPGSEMDAKDKQAISFDFKEVEQKLANINLQINTMMDENSTATIAQTNQQ